MWYRFTLFLGGLLLSGRALLGTEAGPPAAESEFTAEERAWIAAHPVIRIGYILPYEPYTILEKSGKLVGINPDYLQLFTRRTGLRFEYGQLRVWAEILEAFKAHEVDLVLSVSRAPERESFMAYTESYAFAPDVIITRNDSPFLFSLQDLKGKTISVPRGFAGPRNQLKQSAPDSVPVEYDTPLECYKAVAQGDVFASIGDVANASYLIKVNQLSNLRLGSVLFNNPNMYMGVRRDWPLLVSILNKALAGITTEERQQIYNRWIAVDFATDQRWQKAFKVAAVVAAAALTVFLLVFFQSRRLARELAERRRIQAELERTRDQLERTGQEKSELMHMVAHDLRSPLTGIQLSAELLRLDPPPDGDDLKAAAGGIQEAVGKMTRLISDLLSAQNVEEGQFTLNLTAGDAGEAVDAAADAIRPAAQHKRIALETVLPGTATPLTTDFVALHQVLNNLLSNALKYSPPYTRVEVAVVAGAARCRFEVRDQGPGVKPEERKKIFEKFGRGSARPTQGEDSHGLGLWIVQRYVEALHGRVWCEPGPGARGSVFVVEVPWTPPKT